MLAAVCVIEPRRRWFNIRRRKLTSRRPTVRSEFITVGSGKFLKITAQLGRDGQPDWSEVQRAAGREATRLVLPRGVIPPENSRIRCFQGQELARRLMIKAGVALLQAVALNPRLVKVVVYDPLAALPDLPLLFFPYAADVRVVTNRPDRYVQQQFEAMDKYGAVLTISNDINCLNGSLLVLAPNGIPDPHDVSINVRGLILTAVPSGIEKNEGKERQENLSSSKVVKGLVDGYLPRVSHSILNTLPAGCEAQQFFAGLYELSGIKEIAEHPPEFLNMSGHTITLKDAAWRLAGLDIGISV